MRQFKPSVIKQLSAQPHRFEFFQAVRLLENWLKKNGVAQGRTMTDFIRFRNSLSLNFPASQIETLAINYKPSDGEDAAASAKKIKAENDDTFAFEDLESVTLTPAFMGFLGGNGTLPNHYTEKIASHILYSRDDAPRAFMDAFSTRAVSQFYLAWTKYRLELGYEINGQDRFMPLLLSLTGLEHKDLRQRLTHEGEGVLDPSLAHFAALIRHKPVSAEVLRRVLATYFKLSVKVTLFTGHWYAVPRSQQTSLGLNNAILGVTAMTGNQVWQRDLRIHLTLGPLNKTQFEALLPGGKTAKALNSLLKMFTQHEFEYEVQLILAARYVEGNQLGTNPNNGRLGWDTFLLTQPATQDRSDISYTINAIH